jgi:disulfide bond formation protein DsbB
MKPNPFAWPFRWQMAFGAAVSAALVAYAYFWVQKRMLMMPCPLCIFQRIVFGGLVLVGLVAALHDPKGALGRRIYGALAFLVAMVGVGIAGRHVWIQSLPPDQVPSCNSLGLDYMLGVMPVGEVVREVLTGSGECAKVDWTWLGLSMPMWTLACFALLGLGALAAGFRARR